MTEFTAHFFKAPLPRVVRRAAGRALDRPFAAEEGGASPAPVGIDRPTTTDDPPRIDELIPQTRAEMEDARDRYQREARRLRFWQWWFVGMFTFYTTLVGILLLELVTSR
jgi:hypothetical protein